MSPLTLLTDIPRQRVKIEICNRATRVMEAVHITTIRTSILMDHVSNRKADRLLMGITISIKTTAPPPPTDPVNLMDMRTRTT
jgi:hypothetical protein